MELNIKFKNMTIAADSKESFKQRVSKVFNRTSDYIRKVTVTLADINGPKGGVDKECKVKLSLFGLPPILVIAKKDNIHHALSEALAKAKTALTKRQKKSQLFSRDRTFVLPVADLEPS